MVRRGFTIIELLIVLAIMGILLTLGVVNMRSAQLNARDAERRADAETIATNLETFYKIGYQGVSAKSRYPSTAMFDGNSSTFQTYMADIDPRALIPPNAENAAAGFVKATNNVTTTAGVSPQPTYETYVYQPLQSDGSLCTLESQTCATYHLYYKLESDDTVQVIDSKYTGGGNTPVAVTDSLADGLLGWWPLNGNANDLAGSANGSIVGATPTTGQNASANGAYLFNGSGDYIDLGLVSSIGALRNNITVSAWVKPLGTDIYWERYLTNSVSATSNGIGFGMYNNYPGFTTYGVKDYTTTTTNLGTNTWYHVVAVMNSSFTTTFYVNGSYSQAVTHSAQGNANTDDNLYIGGVANTQSFNGVIDDVRIYNRTLSSGEVASLYAQGAQ